MKYLTLLMLLLPLVSFAQGEREAAFERQLLEARKSLKGDGVVLNPVTDFDCPDPSVVRIGEWFYCFKTGYPMKIYRSRNLTQWTYYRDMFLGPSPRVPFSDGKDDPMHTGARPGENINFWAPSPAIIQGKLVVYVTLFVSMQNDRQVVCVADDIDSEFRYAGTLNVGTPEHPTPQDGQYFADDDGRHYLVWGDVNSRGNFLRELAPSGLEYAPGSKPYYITSNYEGGYIYKHKGTYYFFCSKNYFNNADYTLCMCTSKSLQGGWSEMEDVLVSRSQDAVLNGAGHNGEIIEDRDGRLFMVMHAHCEGLIGRRPGSDYNPRPMILMELKEIDGKLRFIDLAGNPVLNPQWLVRAPRF